MMPYAYDSLRLVVEAFESGEDPARWLRSGPGRRASGTGSQGTEERELALAAFGLDHQGREAGNGES